jgi:hypothetical protein
MTEADYAKIGDLLKRAGFELPLKEFKRVASARTLYHWNAEAHHEY